MRHIFSDVNFMVNWKQCWTLINNCEIDILRVSQKYHYTANKLAVLSTAFGSVTFPTVIWLYTEQLMTVHSQWL